MTPPAPNRSKGADGPTNALCGRLPVWVEQEDIGSSRDERHSLLATDAWENIPFLRGIGVEEPSLNGVSSGDGGDGGGRLSMDDCRTIGKVVWGGVEDTSAKGSMRVSVVGSYPKAAGLKMTGLGGLDEAGDGGVGGSLEGEGGKRVTVEGGVSGAISGSGTGGGGGSARVGLAGRVGCEGVGGPVAASLRESLVDMIRGWDVP